MPWPFIQLPTGRSRRSILYDKLTVLPHNYSCPATAGIVEAGLTQAVGKAHLEKLAQCKHS